MCVRKEGGVGGACGGDAVRYFRAIPDCCRLLQAVAGCCRQSLAVAGCCGLLRGVAPLRARNPIASCGVLCTTRHCTFARYAIASAIVIRNCLCNSEMLLHSAIAIRTLFCTIAWHAIALCCTALLLARATAPARCGAMLHLQAS